MIVENNAKVRLVDINVDGGTLKQRVSVASVPKGEKEEEFQSRSIINLPLLGPHQRENAELALERLIAHDDDDKNNNREDVGQTHVGKYSRRFRSVFLGFIAW